MDLAGNWQKVEQRIQAACNRASRNRSEVLLVAVSKGHPPDTVRAAAELGHTLFGENKIQEAKAKISLCPGRLHWHMIGHFEIGIEEGATIVRIGTALFGLRKNARKTGQ